MLHFHDAESFDLHRRPHPDAAWYGALAFHAWPHVRGNDTRERGDGMTPEREAAVRAQMRRATEAVFEVLLDQYGSDDRIAILSGAWDKAVLPGLIGEASAQKLRAFPV